MPKVVRIFPKCQGQQAEAYRQAVEQATVLLAALESDTGRLADADPVAVRRYREQMGDRTLMAKFMPAAEGGSGAVVRRWQLKGSWRHWRGGKIPVDAAADDSGLVNLITRTKAVSAVSDPARDGG